MPIDIGGAPSTPSIKLPAAGDYVTFALVDLESVPWTDYVTGLQKVGKNGDPRTQDLIYGLVVDGEHCLIADDTGSIPLQVKGETKMHRRARTGELVRMYLPGHHRWERIQAFKALGKSGEKVQTGDVCQWKVTGFEPSEGGNDKKVSTFAIRKPKPSEEAQVAECDRLNAEHRAETAAPAMATSGASTDTWADQEEPF